MYDSEKIKSLLEYFQTSPITDLLDEFGIVLDFRGRTPCPLHADSRPSMFVNIEKNIWHCFSCGAGGGVKDLIYELYKQNYGVHSYYDTLERYLATHKQVCDDLGFYSLKGQHKLNTNKSLNNIVLSMDSLQNKKPAEYINGLQLKPDKQCRNPEIILPYLISIQTGGLR